MLHLNTAYHPHTDGQFERTIQILEDMLRDCVLEGVGDVEHLLCWEEVGEKGILGPKVIQETVDKIKIINDKLRIAQSRKKKLCWSLEFEESDRVFLRVTRNVGIGRVLKVKKLDLRFIGPF